MKSEPTLCVLDLPACERHVTIFRTWEALNAGQSFILVNDHDPLPLYYQFAAEFEGEFKWDYIEMGPSQWRVRLTKGAFSHPGFMPERKRPAVKSPVTASNRACVLDVRPIFARGQSPCSAIDEAVAKLGQGQSLFLLVPFEPVPLYAKLSAQGFRHTSFQEEDGSWRIEFQR